MAIFEQPAGKSDHLHELMPFHVQDILLVSSMYDAFLLAEDGRLSQRVFGDFMDLDLHFIPRITRVSSGREALEALDHQPFDLVITMPRISDMTPFAFGAKVKERHGDLPVVLLTYAPVKSSMLKQIRKQRSIDKVFYWFGDSKIFLAIIKTVEDMKNADADTRFGVNVILVVEDSPWYYSSFLPMLYTEIIKQTRRIVSEGVNDVQRMMRIRARPKILTAETFEDARQLADKYRDNLLGVISDVRFPKDGKTCPDAGIQLVKQLKEEVPDLALVLQSNEPGNRKDAESLGIKFINKNSQTMLEELQSFMLTNFGFGDFVFRMPDGRVVARARTLREFARVLAEVPAESLYHHTSRNHVSIWLRARTEFDLAERLRHLKVDDFDGIEQVRRFLLDAISHSMEQERVGIITDFSVIGLRDEDRFSRIGSGSLGGKARGVAFMNAMVHRSSLGQKFRGVKIRTPMTFVLCTDVFEEFLAAGDLRDRAFSMGRDEDVIRLFKETPIPTSVEKDLRAMLMEVKHPIAVRSSSLLEDSQALPFSGIYQSFMLPNNHPDLEVRYRHLLTAIKMVYASVFSSRTRQYVANTNFRVEEERMAILIQRVAGVRHRTRFYPTVSGAAQSYNFYPLGDLDPAGGVATLVLGLGRALADNNRVFRFSPAHPTLNTGYRTPRELLARTQKEFYALDLTNGGSRIGESEDAGLIRCGLDAAAEDGVLPLVSSVVDLENETVDDSPHASGRRVVNFSRLLKGKYFPFTELLRHLLELGEQSVGTPVEIEFALNLFADTDRRPEFNFLQLRPMVAGNEFGDVLVDKVPDRKLLCRSRQTMGNGAYEQIHDLVYVKPEAFSIERTTEIAKEIGERNAWLTEQGRTCVLMGFGRWGSSDPRMGIPVNWGQITAAQVLVESWIGDFRVDASRGNHFFQYMLANRVGYFYIGSEEDGFTDWDWLAQQPAVYEGAYLRHLRFDKSIPVKIDGRSSSGVIFKPKKNRH